MRARLIAAGLAGLALVGAGAYAAARTGESRVQTAAEAEAALVMLARGAAPAELCTPGGRSAFRSAVRAYDSALRREGAALFDDVRARHVRVSEAELLIVAGMIGGQVKPSDVSGEARSAALSLRGLALGWGEAGKLRRFAVEACPELVGLYRSLARHGADQARDEASYRRALRRDDTRRQEVLRERMARRAHRVERETRAERRALERKFDAAFPAEET